MKFLRFLGHEYFLGSLIAILSVLTALASYQGSVANSKQNEAELSGMKNLNDGNAEYLTANQFIVYDYSLYDSWYVNDNETKAAYFQENFSDELQASIQSKPDDPFNETYYNAMYASANNLFDEADSSFENASQWDNRGDKLQLVMLLMALGLAFAAWGSLLKEESNLRIVFAIAAFLVLVLGVVNYLTVPVVG